jgi:hypothetical protein
MFHSPLLCTFILLLKINIIMKGESKMKKCAYILLISALSFQWAACSTSGARIDYRSIGEESKIEVNEGSVNGRSMGIAKGDEGGAIWADCTEKAQDSMKELLLQAKAAGANAVGDIKWHASGNSEPSCKRGWGYLIIWPFVLTPLFMSTAVEAHMYKAEGRRTGLIMIPQNPRDEEKLIKQLVMGH